MHDLSYMIKHSGDNRRTPTAELVRSLPYPTLSAEQVACKYAPRIVPTYYEYGKRVVTVTQNFVPYYHKDHDYISVLKPENICRDFWRLSYFHELAHSTGHPTRLARYPRIRTLTWVWEEELRAHIASLMLDITNCHTGRFKDTATIIKVIAKDMSISETRFDKIFDEASGIAEYITIGGL